MFHNLRNVEPFKGLGKELSSFNRPKCRNLEAFNLPECVVVCKPWVIYLELGRCLLLLSNQLSTSSTACGFFFCSCLLMLEFFSMSAHCSGIPCKIRKKKKKTTLEKQSSLGEAGYRALFKGEGSRVLESGCRENRGITIMHYYGNLETSSVV